MVSDGVRCLNFPYIFSFSAVFFEGMRSKNWRFRRGFMKGVRVFCNFEGLLISLRGISVFMRGLSFRSRLVLCLCGLCLCYRV